MTQGIADEVGQDNVAAQDTAARAVGQCGPGYQIRTRVAGSSHNSSVAPTSNAR
jgi:hypothetical protein